MLLRDATKVSRANDASASVARVAATARADATTHVATTARVDGAARVDAMARADASVLGKRRRARRRRLLRVAAVCLIAWPPAAWVAARALIVRRDLARADAIVVLGGSAAYVERARRAAELYREGRAPRVLLTNDGGRGGWSQAEQRNPFFYERATEELVRAGVPRERIELLPQPTESTYEEARLVRDYADARRLRSLIFVTSAYHTRRALWTMARVFGGSSVEFGIDAPPPGEQTPPPATWWLSASGWLTVALEYPKLCYYLARYR